MKSKAVKAAPKKVEKPAKVAKAPPVATKKTEEKKSPVTSEKTKTLNGKGKAKAQTEIVEVEAATELTPELESLEKVAESKPKKAPKEKKKSALQKKKEKMEFDSNAKWADFFEKYKAVKPANYSMKDAFEANQPIQHKVLGWGWVISSENDRLEVLFKDGKKILISNYKS